MCQLNENGIQFYMDDFGTGYSNMASIINLPFEFIKINKSILYDSINSKKCYSVLTGFCRTFSDEGMKIVIDGVENEEQMKDIKADYIQ
jgi:EAL domain-containing protein (putative c-di-GMP-specific phosphodiesterase class I)